MSETRLCIEAADRVTKVVIVPCMAVDVSPERSG